MSWLTAFDSKVSELGRDVSETRHEGEALRRYIERRFKVLYICIGVLAVADALLALGLLALA